MKSQKAIRFGNDVVEHLQKVRWAMQSGRLFLGTVVLCLVSIVCFREEPKFEVRVRRDGVLEFFHVGGQTSKIRKAQIVDLRNERTICVFENEDAAATRIVLGEVPVGYRSEVCSRPNPGLYRLEWMPVVGMGVCFLCVDSDGAVHAGGARCSRPEVKPGMCRASD